MKKVKIDRKKIRMAINDRLVDSNIDVKSTPATRKFINELLNIPISTRVLAVSAQISADEGIDGDVAERIYTSNAVVGMRLLQQGKSADPFLKNLTKMLSRGGATSI